MWVHCSSQAAAACTGGGEHHLTSTSILFLLTSASLQVPVQNMTPSLSLLDNCKYPHYAYSPLPPGQVRTLLLLPAEHDTTPLRAALVTHPLGLSASSTSSQESESETQDDEIPIPGFEAISYAWGAPDQEIMNRWSSSLNPQQRPRSLLRLRSITRAIKMSSWGRYQFAPTSPLPSANSGLPPRPEDYGLTRSASTSSTSRSAPRRSP
ncbi:hypothetical protein B0T16DRAFT_249196 [Cercophora newfieldiana]|uniref:Heterokaryon incompatibility domain-containing protein n=1 Tax=Cercophora newfieldiana TaxID=92897 RepID=A0AA39XUY6_9PEZI|nr:hypothetical protein B0T16DRAFT_249196 [Cercophora newfieldiana]